MFIGMGLDSLLLTRDPQVVRIVQSALEKLSIDVEVSNGAGSGQEILESEKFDAVVVDCDDLEGGLSVLEKLRKGTSNKNSITFAILNGKTTTNQAFELGANFVLQKPVSALNAMRCFSAALGFMTRERRRYFRQSAAISLTLIFPQGQEIKATTTDISEGGMAIKFTGVLPKGQISKVIFTLPETHRTLEPKADVAWADGAGRAGLRFVDLPAVSQDDLEQWMARQLEKDAAKGPSQPNPLSRKSH